jgi:CheY-like chemotaxis protein
VDVLKEMSRILSISYDGSLLLTRQWILERAGYEVVSALGFAEAVEVCQSGNSFDLIIIGHSMPQKDKTALLKTVLGHCNAPLISLQRSDEPAMAEATISMNAQDGPDAFLECVRQALAN